ncbi:hypothetical protein SAMN04487969_1509 [Paenibacillus algorifonticola]|uniref:Uncharacterized protein n=1 Tax=Paenibacillus algorifonticola TaxID=684063 RepID=A0A1I2J2Q2_9BACL|nr:hypothetical protein [Paenibacillus algorifonticola]SFF48280.1 hypothetical protein SAMN04487969_1509 [Paenibacillus algorifonticola]
MAKKKVVIMIVEGVSDERALSTITQYVKRVFDVHIHFSNGDVFTKYSNKQAKAIVGDEIRKVMNERKFSKKDILAVIQVTDTDGTFIDNKYVKIDNNVGEKALYFGDSICVSDSYKAVQIQKRNKEKAHSLKTMYTTAKVMDIPYFLLYFSCNLDHVLHHERNLAEEYKDSKAREFSKRFKDKPNDFYEFFNNNDFVVEGSMKETWEFIQKDGNSLGRYSNFNIIFTILNEVILDVE